MTPWRTDPRAARAKRDAALARPELSADEIFRRTVATTIRDAMKMKLVMGRRKIKAAKAKCPECEGVLYGRLVGPKLHMRFWCDGTCKRQLIE